MTIFGAFWLGLGIGGILGFLAFRTASGPASAE